MVKLVYTYALGAYVARRGGSSPLSGTMQKLILVGIISGMTLLGLTKDVIATSAPYPPTPTKETLEKLRELGRQNELRYGRGGTTNLSPVTKTPTLTLTPTPTILPTSTPTPTPTTKQITNQLQELWVKIWSFILGWQKNGPAVPTITPTPTSTSTPTPTQPSTASAQQLWQKGFDIWVGTKNYNQASIYYKQALAIDPNFVPALASYGYMLGAFYNRFNEGEAMLKKAMQLNPEWAYAPYNLGLLYDISGRREEGIYWLQYTVDHFPTHPDIDWFKDHLRVAKEWQY